jgi:hypothetical protein
MATNRPIAMDHKVGPSPFVLHSLITFFNPNPQAIEPDDFATDACSLLKFVVRYQVALSGKVDRQYLG